MTLEKEIDALQHHLDRLASEADDELVERYEMKRPPVPPGLYWQLRWLAGRLLRWLRLIPIWRRDPWPASLKQQRADANAKPILIWALGTDRATLRAACDGLSRLQKSLRGFAPVLVTDVADFAFFSRLGWLVEYVPRLDGEGYPYDERKLKFLARLYFGAPALPVSSEMKTDFPADEIGQWLVRLAPR